jgi:hypothetical protein
VDDGRQLAPRRRPDPNIARLGHGPVWNFNIKILVIIAQLLRERDHLIVAQRRSLEVEQARTDIAHFFAEITARAENAQRASIVKSIR